MPADGEVVLLDGQGFGAGREGRVGRRDGGIRSGAGQHGEPQVLVEPSLVGLPGGLPGAEQHVLAARTEQQDGAQRRRPGEVTDVRRTRDECGGVSGGRTAVAKQAPAGRVHV